MSESGKLGGEISLMNEKNELKKQRQQVETMKNRVELLRAQLQKEKEGVRKHKQLTKDAIQKKLQVSKINQWKERDNRYEMDRIDELRRRNQDLRMSHEKQLQDIQKAIYLVKLDDAREVKNMSQQHTRRLQQMDRQFLSGQQRKKRRVAEESQAAKQRYVQYWKDKLAGIYSQQAQTVVEVGKQKEEQKKEMRQLEEEEIKLMEEINKYHSQGVEKKKEYLAALSLPVRDVAEAVGASDNALGASKRKNMTISGSRVDSEGGREKIQLRSEKMPNAMVNQDKLKVVLQQLKKVERSSLHTSR